MKIIGKGKNLGNSATGVSNAPCNTLTTNKDNETMEKTTTQNFNDEKLDDDTFELEFQAYRQNILNNVKYPELISDIKRLALKSDQYNIDGWKIYDMDEIEWKKHAQEFRVKYDYLDEEWNDDDALKKVLIFDLLHEGAELLEYALNDKIEILEEKYNQTVELKVNENNETIVTIVDLTDENKDMYFYDTRIVGM